MIDEEAAWRRPTGSGSRERREVRERILALPAFQENGSVHRRRAYRQILRMQMPPMRPDEFENQCGRLTVEKLQAASHRVDYRNEETSTQEYKRRNEKVKLAVVTFPADKFRAARPLPTRTSPDFDEHKEIYRVPEKRKIRFLTIDQEATRAKDVATGQQIERSYKATSSNTRRRSRCAPATSS